MATVTPCEYSLYFSQFLNVYFPSLSILFLPWKRVGGCVMTTSSLSVLHPSIISLSIRMVNMVLIRRRKLSIKGTIGLEDQM